MLNHKKANLVKSRFSFDELENIFLYFSTSIMDKENEDEILWDLARNCIAQLGFEDCVIYLINNEENVLEQKAAYGPKNPRDYNIYNPIKIPLGQGICGTVAMTGEAEIISDTSLDERYIVDDQIRYSELTVPIKLEGKVIGVIDCEHPKKEYFNTQHQRIIEAMASICAIKISKLRTEKAIKIEQKKLQEAQQLMEDLRISVFKSQMNPHFLFNAMNAVQYFITSDDKKSALTYMSVLGKLMRYRLSHFQDETALLQQELEAVQWYLTLQKMRFDATFSFDINMLNSNEKRKIEIPSMVLPVIIEAAVTSTVRDQQKGFIKLTFQIQDDFILLNLRHNLNIPNVDKNVKPPHPIWLDQINLINDLKRLDINTQYSFQTIDGEIGKIKATIKIPILP